MADAFGSQMAPCVGAQVITFNYDRLVELAFLLYGVYGDTPRPAGASSWDSVSRSLDAHFGSCWRPRTYASNMDELSTL